VASPLVLDELVLDLPRDLLLDLISGVMPLAWIELPDGV
jgi:hypothetical protein